MSSYTHRTLYVLPSSNTLPTSGGTQQLDAGQFGIFNGATYAAVTNGNIAAAPYILMSQGRPVDIPTMGTKQSAYIYADEILEWYKIEAHDTAAVQITEITGFDAKCGEDVTVSVRIRSKQSDTGFYNGLTRSYTITTPCCECGEDPCTAVDEEALVDDFVEKINADVLVNQYLIAEKLPDGDTFKIRLTGKQPASENQYKDPAVNQHWFDLVRFWAYAYRGPDTTQNFMVYDACDPFATVTTVQEATYVTGSSLEVKQMEYWYNSLNQHPIAKALFRHDIYNSGFESLVETGTYYDLYVIKFNIKTNRNWNPTVAQDAEVILAIPTGEATDIETMLTTYLGAPEDKSGNLFTTTTTTSSTTTTTTTAATTTSTTTTTTTL